MKAYKIEVLVIDFESAGEQDIRQSIENCKYISAHCMNAKQADIGQWSDDHPLNQRDKMHQAYLDLFR